MLQNDVLARKTRWGRRGAVNKLTPRLVRRRNYYANLKILREKPPLQLRDLPTGFSGPGVTPTKRLMWPKRKKVPKGPWIAKVHKGSPPKGAKPLNESWQAEQDYWFRGTQHDNGVLTQSTAGHYNFFNARSRTGTTLPGWKKIIQNGGNATTVFNGLIRQCTVKQEFSHRAVWYSSPNVYSVEELSGFPYWYNLGFGNPSATDPIALEQASKFFLRRLQEVRQAMQGGVFSGEIRETLRMLRRPASALRDGIPKYLDSLAKRRAGGMRKSTARSKSQREREDSKRAVQLKKMAGDTWLEFSFGWKPLISDINDAIKAIGRLNENKFVQKLSAKGKNEKVNYDSGTNEYPIADQFVTWIKVHQHIKTDYQCQIRGAVRVSTTTSKATANRELFGFSWEQFIPTLWELVPYSFLVDYFTNIGDILEAAAVNTADLAWTSRTQRAQSVAFASAVISSKTSSNVSASLDPGNVERFARVISRDAGGPVVPQFRWSIPSLLVSTPTGEQALNTQWANMAALSSKLTRLIPFHRT